MGFIHPTADCAVLLLALSGLDMLAQVRIHGRSDELCMFPTADSFVFTRIKTLFAMFIDMCGSSILIYTCKSVSQRLCPRFVSSSSGMCWPQRPTILHRFYHSDRLPALFYVSFVADFDVQVCALFIYRYKYVFSRTFLHPYVIVSHACSVFFQVFRFVFGIVYLLTALFSDSYPSIHIDYIFSFSLCSAPSRASCRVSCTAKRPS